MNIAVAGTGYVGLSIATLLAQHNHVTAVDVIPEKVDKINRRVSPIQDEYIEKYLAEKPLDLTATLDGRARYTLADVVGRHHHHKVESLGAHELHGLGRVRYTRHTRRRAEVELHIFKV